MKASNEGQYPYLRMNNISYEGYWDFSSLKYIDLEKTDLEKYSIKKGDVIFNRTNSKELVGKTAVYDRGDIMVIAGYLIRLRVNEKANPWFIWGYLNSYHGKATLLGLCRNIVGMANINAKELQGIKILIPPIEIQNQFAEIVEQVKKIKIRYYESRDELKELFAALNQKAFKGELDFNEDFDFEDQATAKDAIDIAPIEQSFPEKIEQSPEEQPRNIKNHQPVFDDLLPFINQHFRNGFFTFEDLKKTTIQVGWIDDFEMLKDFVFQLIRENKIRQVFADASFKAELSEVDPDFSAVRKLEERIYLQTSIP
ncbi:MAG: restriction endonuclease subunit S [Haliscomenobacter sp.]|nr:restriction endonuclease subunit S [Haliscomenobacter sp.]